MKSYEVVSQGYIKAKKHGKYVDYGSLNRL